MCRGSCADRMCPKVGDPTKMSGKPKLGRLSRLNDSARTCSAIPSRRVVFFTSEKLMVWNDGPSRILRPELPKLPYGGTANAAVLNQRSGVWCELCGSLVTFGRSLAPKPRMDCPALLLSKF